MAGPQLSRPLCQDTLPSATVVLHHDEHTEGPAENGFANDRMVPGKKWRRKALACPYIDASTGESASGGRWGDCLDEKGP